MDVADYTARPCCVFRPVTEIPIKNYINQPEVQHVRQQILNGEIPSQCSYCVTQEQQTGKSFRTQSNRFDFSPDLNNYYTVDNAVILNLLVSGGNACNLKCIHCSAGSSYPRGLELFKLNLLDEKPTLMAANTNSLSENLTDLDVKKITIAAGEPFYDKNILTFLQNLPYKKDTSRIDLDINTNLTKISKELIDFLVENYKSLQIKASIDGFGISNDYLRYPSKWKQVENAVDLLKCYPNIEISVTTSVSNLSLLHLPRLIKWVIDKKIRNHYFTIVSNPSELTSFKLPCQLKELLLNEFLKLKSTIDLDYHNRTVELLELCINLCNNTNYSESDTTLLIEFLTKHDRVRGTNFLQTFPELTNFV